MGTVIRINDVRQNQNIRFKVKIIPVIEGKFEVINVVVIVLEDLSTGKVLDVTYYSEFTCNILGNKEINTRLKYAGMIAMFLNYLFFDRELIRKERYDERVKKLFENKNRPKKNLDKIEHLTVNDGEWFLVDYANGRVGTRSPKGRQSVEVMEMCLTKFYYFLVSSKHFVMKYIKLSQFKTREARFKSEKGSRKILSLKSIFRIIYPKPRYREKVKYISFYSVAELISLSFEKYPMISLGIALQAFAGLRVGEVCNVTRYNFRFTDISGQLSNFEIDLREKPQLRSDGTSTGEIKTKGVAYVHKAFEPYFQVVYKRHAAYIENIFKRKNKYGAMFMNNRGFAMTDKSYNRYFNILIKELVKRLINSGQPILISEAKRIMELGLTPHTLRHFFSQYLSGLKDVNIFELAAFRRDSTLDSVMVYIRNNPFLIDMKISEYQNNKMREWNFEWET